MNISMEGNHRIEYKKMRNDCFTSLDTTFVQLQQFFFSKLTIGSILLYVGLTYLMVDFFFFF